MLNVEKSRADKIYNNEKLQPVILAVGAGIGADFDINKIRYGKIIIMADADVAARAKEAGSTRAAACMEKACTVEGPVIIAVGNAPTALVRLDELVKEGKIKPALVIGVPVGFVNVVESKEIIMQTGIPYIVAVGRKGGSNVAAAICNALIYKLTR